MNEATHSSRTYWECLCWFCLYLKWMSSHEFTVILFAVILSWCLYYAFTQLYHVLQFSYPLSPNVLYIGIVNSLLFNFLHKCNFTFPSVNLINRLCELYGVGEVALPILWENIHTLSNRYIVKKNVTWYNHAKVDIVNTSFYIQICGLRANWITA